MGNLFPYAYSVRKCFELGFLINVYLQLFSQSYFTKITHHSMQAIAVMYIKKFVFRTLSSNAISSALLSF